MSSEKIAIFDTTLRDGEQCPGASMNTAAKLEVARQLARLNVDVMEAGFPIASPGDFEAVHKIASEIKGPVIAALARITEKDIYRAGEALKPASRRRIHTFSSGSDIHLEAMMRLTRAQNLDKSVKAVKLACAYTSDVEYSAQDTTRSDRKYLVELYTAVAEAGATTLNVPDTVGYAIPEEYGELIAYLVANVKVPGIVFSVHCHNDLGLAVANSLAAVRAGARQVECTINGIGERAGNCSLEEVVMALKTRQDFFKAKVDVATKEITRASRLVSSLTGMQVQPNKAIVGSNAFAHESGIHQDGVLKAANTYEIMSPASVGLSDSNLVLGKHSGRHALKKRLAFLGVEADGAKLDELYEAFKKLADRKKDIYDDDLLLLGDAEERADKGDFIFKSLQVTSGTGITPQCVVVLEHEGRELKHVGTGNGAVDAIYNTMAALTKTQYGLVTYSIKAATGGTDAQGEVTVVLENKDQRVSARGADTDVLVASAKAYLAAVNKMNRLKDRKGGIKGV